MSYRKIEVNGKTYEWVTGKEFTKVKGLGTFLNSLYGIPVAERDAKLDESDVDIPAYTHIVSKAGVGAFIRGIPPRPYRRYCERHDFWATGVVASPYASEIYGKISHMANCPSCLMNDADDI